MLFRSASEIQHFGQRKYHGYVICGRHNTVMIHTPRKDQIYDVYRSLLEASSELVQFLIDEGKFAPPEVEARGGLGFYDCWVNRDLNGEAQRSPPESSVVDEDSVWEGGEDLNYEHESNGDRGMRYASVYPETSGSSRRVGVNGLTLARG